jgi:hypothetical protein
MRTIVIRIILTLFLIYGAYKETGPVTAMCLFLIFSYIELVQNKDKILKSVDK